MYFLSMVGRGGIKYINYVIGEAIFIIGMEVRDHKFNLLFKGWRFYYLLNVQAILELVSYFTIL